jgi:cytochrome P450
MSIDADFVRTAELLEIYGPCISTASWVDWPRHRKVIASPFNEGNMKYVWDESLKQVHQMLEIWASESTSQVSNFSEDTRILSLNVLAAMGFRQSYEFHSANESDSSETDDLDYRKALKAVLDNCILLMVISRKILSHRFAPKSWQRVARAASNYEDYMVQSFTEEEFALRVGKPGKGGLMTSFVHAMDQPQGKVMDTRKATGLTVQEIFGNFFVINFAGHDTTAKAFAYALLLLTAHPEVQDWVAEELQHLVPVDGEWEYDVLFPKLKRCKAILVRCPACFFIIGQYR